MGSCCFTPTKRDFLWWYWLLLASIVGIPMLLAVLYVADAPEFDETTKRSRARIAALIFWLGSFLVAIGTFFFVYHMTFVPYDGRWESHKEPSGFFLGGWIALAVQFFFATVGANGANSLVRNRRWFVRIPLVVFCIAIYIIVASSIIGIAFRHPAIHVMQFMACMLPAHYWGEFKATSDTQSAWRALWAFVAGAALFFLVSYFGEDFARWIWGLPKLGR